MTEISDMLASLKRIESILGSIEAVLADTRQKLLSIEGQMVGNQPIRDRLRRLRQGETK